MRLKFELASGNQEKHIADEYLYPFLLSGQALLQETRNLILASDCVDEKALTTP